MLAPDCEMKSPKQTRVGPPLPPFDSPLVRPLILAPLSALFACFTSHFGPLFAPFCSSNHGAPSPLLASLVPNLHGQQVLPLFAKGTFLNVVKLLSSSAPVHLNGIRCKPFPFIRGTTLRYPTFRVTPSQVGHSSSCIYPELKPADT